MPNKQIHIIFYLLVLALSGLGQTAGSLFYDIGLMIDDSTRSSSEIQDEALESSEVSQEEQDLEEALNRYQIKLAETEIRMRHQTSIIDSLQTEITLIRAAGATDQALLSSRINTLEDQQAQVTQDASLIPKDNQISERVFAELDTPWKNGSVTRSQISPPHAVKLSPQEEEAAYRKGLTKFHQQFYYQAIGEFNAIVNGGSDITLRANAQYWVGRCYFEKGLYDEAISALEQVQRFEYSDKLDDSLVLIGLSFKNKDRLPEAKLAFQELVTRHPGSEYLTLAKRFVQK